MYLHLTSCLTDTIIDLEYMQSGSCVTPFKRGTDFTSRLVEISVEIGVEVNSLRLDWVMLKLGFDRILIYIHGTRYLSLYLPNFVTPFVSRFPILIGESLSYSLTHEFV